jgi:2-polyprenyl-3-methyl-5-hydroxy-6-metoxy-1,4-benzoquinol methylase
MPVGPSSREVEELAERYARSHSIEDYYESAFWPIRMIESRRLAIVRELVGPSAGLDLAEVGSGGGHVLEMFREARITAFDVSDVFLDKARLRLAGYDARFVKGEVDKLDLPGESFDRIICTEVLEHTFDPEAVLAAIARLLRPQGVAVITVPNDPLIVRIKGLLRWTPLGVVLQERIDWGGDRFHLHQWTPRAFEALLGRFFRVTARRHAPIQAIPIRACFRCTRLQARVDPR